MFVADIIKRVENSTVQILKLEVSLCLIDFIIKGNNEIAILCQMKVATL